MNFERRKAHSFFLSPIILGVVVVVFLVTAYQAWRSYVDTRAALQKKEEVSQKLIQREREIKDLESKIAAFESGEGLEMEAKGKLNLKKPDEHVVIIVPAKDATSTASQSAATSFWQKIRDFFSIGK